MATVIRSPRPLPTTITNRSVFLAGTIDLGNSEDWQEHVVSNLTDMDVTVFNPRRMSWNGAPVLANTSFNEQVKWELDAMERADVIAMYLTGNGSPVSMLELGLHIRSGKLLVGCDPYFHRHGNVVLTCERYNVPQVGSLKSLIRDLRVRLAA